MQAGTGIPLSIIDPLKIKTDAATYQFRSGGDAHGVTDESRIKDASWNPILHGDPILVHERLDGSFFVADGHHRLDFAQRLTAEGHGPGGIAALVLREADGYTPEDVRVIAAYKNMAHGHSKPVEAARVFKEAMSGRVHTNLLPQLQMEKDNLKLSYRLSRLSEKGLDRVESGEIPIIVGAELADRIAVHAITPEREGAVMDRIHVHLTEDYHMQQPLKPTRAPAPVQPQRMGSMMPEWVPGFAAEIARKSAWPQQRMAIGRN